jgi:hypothetical protein
MSSRTLSTPLGIHLRQISLHVRTDVLGEDSVFPMSKGGQLLDDGVQLGENPVERLLLVREEPYRPIAQDQQFKLQAGNDTVAMQCQ